MINKLYNIIFKTKDREEQLFGVSRSSQWKTVRDKFIKKNPCCEVCGATKNLTVHHKLPFHVFPHLELDEKNLVTLCEGDVVNCHFLFGHLLNWKNYNKDIDFDIFTWRNKLNKNV